jgi:hypothetical protein
VPRAPRERKPALAAFAVLLILVGALGSVVLVLRSGDRVSVVGIAQRVAVGTKIPTAAMTEMLVAEDPSINYVLWSQRGALARYYAATDLVKGSLLVGPMLTTKEPLARGTVVVGLSLKAGQYPVGLRVGDKVQAFLVGSRNGGTGAAKALVEDATVYRLPTTTSGRAPTAANQNISVVVAQSSAGELAEAASAGNVALVLVPRSVGG